jgi:hypothetical protein
VAHGIHRVTAYHGQDVTGAALVGVTAIDVVGSTVVGATVVGATVVGATVVGATVVGATVVGATVVGATVVGATVVGATVVGLTVVGATVGLLLVLPAAGVVGVVPDAEVDGCTTGPTVVPLVVVVGLIRAFMIGESPVTVPDRFVEPPITFGLPPELPSAFAWAAAGDSFRSGAAGQLASLQAMNPFDEVPDWDAPIPYQQMSVMAPSTPVPITRFRTECGRCKSSSFGCCRYNRFPPLFMAVS